jgi:hypothetical protein
MKRKYLGLCLEASVIIIVAVASYDGSVKCSVATLNSGLQKRV